MSISSFIEQLKAERGLDGDIAYSRKIEPKTPDTSPIPDLHPALVDKLKQKGLTQLYSHQAQAINCVMDGNNVIVATPTASGKSLCYMAPVINDFLNDPDGNAIFLFPLKALEHDQLKAFRELTEGLPGDISAQIFDGDTSAHHRKKILADPPRVIFTNPDMLHLSILPYHAKWEEFFKKLKYIIVDETHTYRGVFGSHVALLFRRLNRIASYYGAKLQFICCSATISNPGSFAETLTGCDFEVVDKSGAPRPGGHFVVYDTDASPYTDASKIFRHAISANLKTIAFTKSRKITELIYTWTAQADPDLAGRVSCYRAGFLPEERRQIEQDLFSGKLDGVVSTSALEMGVDIGGLDVCVLVGYPGTIINTWQRSGRVGRGDREFLIVLVAQPDALDQYFVRHPEELFTRGFESAIIDPDNEPILKGHIVCAAAELPILADDKWFSPIRKTKEFNELIRERRLALSKDGNKWLSPRHYPHRDVRIRSIGDSYTIFINGGQTIIGDISGSRVFKEGHKGAVYLHKGRQYVVERLDLEKRAVHVKPMDERYYTRARSDKETEILEVLKEKQTAGFTVKLGKLKVTEQVIGYEKRAIFGQGAMGVFDLESPITEFETVGFWIEIDDAVKSKIENNGLGFMGGIHAFEHGVIAMFPLFALCDRDDIGGIAYAHYPALGHSAIFFYDGYPGGLGLCSAVFDKVEDLWESARKLIADCDCEVGCPSCIHSPKCGSGNKPLDKQAAVTLLEYVCGVKKAPAKSKKTTPAVKVVTPAPRQTMETDMEYFDPAPQQRILFFDLETKKSADEVGGWGAIHLMELAVAVIYDSQEKKYIRYWEDDVNELIEKLLSADLVVGFNHIRFDYTVLSGYSDINLARKARSFDILNDVYRRLKFRLSLGHLATETLGKPKSADGLQSLEWWREGKYEQVADYCQVDVEITKELFEYGLEHEYLAYKLKNGETARINLDWDLDQIIKDAGSPPAAKKRRIKF